MPRLPTRYRGFAALAKIVRLRLPVRAWCGRPQAPTATLTLEFAGCPVPQCTTVPLAALGAYCSDMALALHDRDRRMITWRALRAWYPWRPSYRWRGTPAARFHRASHAGRTACAADLLSLATRALRDAEEAT